MTEQNENEPMMIAAEISGFADEAYVIVHSGPEGLLPEHSNTDGGGINAHAFGPYFSPEEVESWLVSPDSCLKFVLHIRAVRTMARRPARSPAQRVDVQRRRRGQALA